MGKSEYDEFEKEWKHRGGLYFGIILVVFGVLFTLENLGYIDNVWRFWPLILVLVGLVFVVGHFTRK
jgi:hypothetical protein